jgi:hypothetical protein
MWRKLPVGGRVIYAAKAIVQGGIRESMRTDALP